MAAIPADVLTRLRRCGVMAGIALAMPADASRAARAVEAGGIDCVEVMLRTAAAIESISAIRAASPGLLLAAGTVLSIRQVDDAMAAGADLVVTPGLSPDVVEYCLANGVPIMPGVATPTEIQLAMSYGFDAVKLFPAGPLGGPAYLRNLAGPYAGMGFVPTGDVDATTLASYLAIAVVLACAGTWLVPRDGFADAHAGEATLRAREATAIVASVRGVETGTS